MANDGIGITFMPSADPNAQGPQNAGDTGAGGSLSDAFKILSLRLPQTVGPRSLASERLLTARGSTGANGFNPHAAVFEALLRALVGQGPAPTDLLQPSPNPYRPGLPGGTRSGNQTGPGPLGSAPFGTEPTGPKISDTLTLTPRVVPGTTPDLGTPEAGRPDRDYPSRGGGY